MNYYASGGQAHGLKSLAQELPKYGRNGDTIVAHINPEEAGILKALGGSGTINPVTGLPEFGIFKSISRAVAAPFRAVNQVVKAIPVIGPAIDKGLVSLDKAVGSAIPGGWNTLAQTALAFTPLGLPAKVGLAALGGSGAFGPSGKFNFQRALLSGALAYGANQLAQGLQEAGGGVTQGGTTDVIARNLGVEGAGTGIGSQAEMLARPEFGGGFDIVPRGLADAIPKEAALQAANTGLSNAAANPDVFSGLAGTQQIVAQPSAASNFASDFLSKTGANLSAAGQGIKNLTGFGTGAAEAATKFAAPVTAGGVTALGVGAMGLASLDEQEKLLNQQYQQGAVNDSEYQRQMEIIADGRRRAEEAMRANPYQFAKGGEVPGYFSGGVMGAIGPKIDAIVNQLTGRFGGPIGAAQPSEAEKRTELANAGIRQNILDTSNSQQLQDYLAAMRKSENERSAYRSMINNPYGFAVGGSVDDEFGYDSATGRSVGNMDRGLFGMGYAAGGQPRFLSGGGDGMSDSIPATINNKQPARLADGEFVIPADVVSHLGNGSSKAGAKRLYSMMDKVRQARTGKKEQAPAVNTRRLMPA